MLNKIYFFQYYAEGDVCNTGLISLIYETLLEGDLFIRIIHNTYFSDSLQWASQKPT